jgi:hypothetical protein
MDAAAELSPNESQLGLLMPDRRLILHIGLHKTGSTAIQRTLLENRACLRDQGIEYPDIGFLLFGHHNLVRDLQSDPPSYAAMSAKIMELQGTVVISSENLARIAPRYARALRDSLPFDEVAIVCYVRSFIKIIYSWWQEEVKHRKAFTFPEFLSRALLRPLTVHVFNVNAVLDAFSVFGRDNIYVYEYDIACGVDGNIVDHFFGTVLKGASYMPVSGKGRVNEAFDLATIEVIRVLNSFGLHGLGTFWRSQTGLDLVDAVRLAAPKHTRSLEISYDSLVFGFLERRLAQEWGTRLTPAPENGTIFRERNHTVEYLDPALWALEPALLRQANDYLRRIG